MNEDMLNRPSVLVTLALLTLVGLVFLLVQFVTEKVRRLKSVSIF